MFGSSGKTFVVYEKPEAAEPTERVVLLRDGFSWGAFVFNALWLLVNRQWLVLALYVAAVMMLATLAQLLQLSEPSAMLMQLWLQVMLGFHAYDLQGWLLTRRGYRAAGILVAESAMHAQRRYDQFAA
jgi:hypothetical protein